MMQMYELVYHENETNNKGQVISRYHVVVSHPLSKSEAEEAMKNFKTSPSIYRPKLGDRVSIICNFPSFCSSYFLVLTTTIPTPNFLALAISFSVISS